MKFVYEANPWTRRFAWIPIFLTSEGKTTCIWMERYWSRDGGDCTETSLTDPNGESK